jgi:hypothetical protein
MSSELALDLYSFTVLYIDGFPMIYLGEVLPVICGFTTLKLEAWCIQLLLSDKHYMFLFKFNLYN